MKLDVIKHSRLYLTLSALLIVVGIVGMIISWRTIGLPLRPSIDFTGGTRLTLELVCEAKPDAPNSKCGKPIDITAVRKVMADKGYANSLIQLLGQESRGVSIQTVDLEVEQRSQLQSELEKVLTQFGKLDPAKSQIERVGPVLGSQLLTSGLLASLLSFAGIAVYLGLRFQPDYAFFAIVSLFHDVLVTAGIFAILGLTLTIEVDSLFVVSMLTIIGFSVNDTVVIYDRIRENIQVMGEGHDFNELVNISVNQTLARSINTTVTALLPLIAIFLFGGPTLKYFALALIIGFVSGAYSSIFNASILLAWWRSRDRSSPNSPVSTPPDPIEA